MATNYSPETKHILKWLENNVKYYVTYDDAKIMPSMRAGFDVKRFMRDVKKEIADESDKVKPKFKVGDWVVGANNVLKIISLNDELNCYIAVTQNNEEVKIPYYFDDGQGHMCSYRIWAIQDATDGDVLAFDDETIVIFKDLYNATTFHSYCYIEDGTFSSKDDMPSWWEGKGFHPATKEQRDTLFAKMKEAGYKLNKNLNVIKI